MKTAAELRAARAYVAALLLSIHERLSATAAEGETRNEAQDTADDEAFRSGSEWMTTTAPELEALEARERQVEELRSLAQVPGATQPGDTRASSTEGFNVNTRTSDPFNLDEVRAIHDPDKRGAEYRARARDAAEQAPHMTDEQREAVTHLIEHDGAQFGPNDEILAPAGARSQYILEHGGPQYTADFHEAIKTGRLPARAAMSLTGANGGFLMPFHLDPTVILTNDGAINPFRAISRVVPITTNVWHGVSSAGVTAEWIGEATEVADGSPTFLQPTITCRKADAYIQGSMEVLADTTLSGEIAGLIADAKNRLEATAHAVGNGVTQPRGVVTATSGAANLVAGSSGAAGAADLVPADIFALDNALATRWRQNAQFAMNKAIANKVRQLNNSTTPFQSTFWVDFGGANPSKLIGYQVNEASAMDSTIVSGSTDDVIVLGDFSQYLIVDRMGVELAYNPLVIGSSFRPTGESAWVAFWRNGADTTHSGAFKLLRL